MRSARATKTAAVSQLVVPGFELMLGRHEAASVLPRHSHDLPTICCVHSGHFTEYYSGKVVDCGTGMVKVTPAGDPHWNRFDTTDTFGVRIDVDRSRFEDLPAVHRVLDERVFVSHIGFERFAGRLISEMCTPDDAATVAVEGLLLELVSRLARVTDGQQITHAPWLHRARQMIAELHATRLSLSGVAAAVGVHPATLAKAYRRAFGCTVGEHIRVLRLERAADALARTTRPLSDIALECGFYDQSHFSNVFRRRFSCTPGEYRMRLAGRAAAPRIRLVRDVD
jgi:AraC family transcriptional regulator